jgi:Tfp pilus assembly protein PilV
MSNKAFSIRQRQAGVGLIEVLISLLILAGGFQTQLTQNQAIAMQRAEATLIADQQLNQLVQQSSVAKLSPQSNTATSITGVNAVYEINWLTVNKSSASPSSFNTNTNCASACDVQRIDVVVYWNDASNARNNVSLSRLISLR